MTDLEIAVERLERTILAALAIPPAERLWSITEVAEFAGYGRIYTEQEIITQPTFPKPIRATGERAKPRWPAAISASRWAAQTRAWPRSGKVRDSAGKPRRRICARHLSPRFWNVAILPRLGALLAHCRRRIPQEIRPRQSDGAGKRRLIHARGGFFWAPLFHVNQ